MTSAPRPPTHTRQRRQGRGQLEIDLPTVPIFRFVDLFAGIGGFRIALQRLGGECAYTVERDRFARQSYSVNFSEPEGCDIRDVTELPPHDVLAAGFPCQPFSIAGVSKKVSLGRAHGFLDQAQGTLFFELARLIEQAQPAILLLENVRNLVNHDRGRTFLVILEALDALGYETAHRVIDARSWVPQHRERIFIVGLRRNVFGGRVFDFPDLPSHPHPTLRDILGGVVEDRYILSQHLWNYLQAYAAGHRAKGNGFGFGLVGPDDVTRTLSARYHKDGSEILVRTDGERPRRLTPRECARLMGFPEEYQIVVSDTQAYRQFGNAVVPAVVEHVGRAIIDQVFQPDVARSSRSQRVNAPSLASRKAETRVTRRPVLSGHA